MAKQRADSPGVIAPPPLLYAGSLLVGLAIDHRFPLALFSGSAAKVVGVFLILSGVALVYWSFIAMRHIGTSANPYKAAQALAMDGPYRFSRNPIYVAMNGAYIGTSLLIDSIWPIVLLPPLMALMNWGVIFREERHLEEKFGGAYQAYKKRVRRWL